MIEYKNCMVLSIEATGTNKNPFEQATINIHPNIIINDNNSSRIRIFTSLLRENKEFTISIEEK